MDKAVQSDFWKTDECAGLNSWYYQRQNQSYALSSHWIKLFIRAIKSIKCLTGKSGRKINSSLLSTADVKYSNGGLCTNGRIIGLLVQHWPHCGATLQCLDSVHIYEN